MCRTERAIAHRWRAHRKVWVVEFKLEFMAMARALVRLQLCAFGVRRRPQVSVFFA